MELSGRPGSEPYGFTRLLGRRVVDQSGRRLGRAFEVIARRSQDGTLTVAELMVGKAGMLRRLKGPAASGDRIPWEAIAEIRDDRIVVRL